MEPLRLLEDNPSDVERALLNAGAAYRCSPVSRAKTFAALGLVGSATITATGVGLSATSLAAKLGWPKIILAVAAIGAVTSVPVGYYVWTRYRATPTVAVPTVSVGIQPVQPTQQNRGDIPKPESERNPPLAVAATEDGTRVSGPTKTEPKVDSSVTLSEELAALDAARALLAHGDPSGALVRLDSYNRSFPKGRLQLEAEVLRIEALMKSGQQDFAKKRAQAFLTKHPNSVLASRVRALL